jgi:hypothetical protein
MKYKASEVVSLRKKYKALEDLGRSTSLGSFREEYKAWGVVGRSTKLWEI